MGTHMETHMAMKHNTLILYLTRFAAKHILFTLRLSDNTTSENLNIQCRSTVRNPIAVVS